MALHSVTEAAKMAGVTRRTIYRYLKSGKLSAAVTNDDTTQIETSELLRVFGSLSQPEAEEVSTESQGNEPEYVTRLLDEMSRLREIIESQQTLLLEDKQSREQQNAERQQQSELIEQLQRERDALSQALDAERKKGFWKKLFG
ncbi:entry exclusion protein 1 [Enterobacter asburiae]|jgi:predicted transcriptional regulator|uniref:helix-turn-helix domain-containing protein n=1 Tax=Enterobacteriaceae TaxID=543 RepID=UPI000CFB3FE9|nr:MULTISPECIES: helix-turn-helix domain-containing protein [Enterobacteriaceae]MCR4460153.1 entry exclusion protein 1 [Pseudescherichia sp. L3]RUN93466.1 entry exclusion protein 1 [Enterobacter asburiae]